MYNNPKSLIIFGHKSHGKDTVSEYLRDKYGFTFASSSETAIDLWLFDKYKDEFGFATKQEMFEGRDEHREVMYNEICDFCKDDLARLGRIILGNNNIYCGIRDPREYNQIKADGLFDLSICVDASARKPKESSNSNKMYASMADVVLDNNGTPEQLYTQIDRLVLTHSLLLKSCSAFC